LAEGAEFSFLLSDGSIPSHGNPTNAASRFLAVFNEDYVERSLTWKEGAAKPIIYLGKEQAELAKELTELEAEEAAAAPEEVLRNSEWSSAQRALETKCRDTARLIAEELNLGRQYNASHLRSDYKEKPYAPSDKLTEEERKRLKEVINRSDIPARLAPFTAPEGGDAAYEKVAKALTARVHEIAIAALQRRKDALEWVEQGVELHAGEQECLFCGNTLLGSRMHELEEALKVGFDTFSAELAGAAQEAVNFLENCRRHKERLATSTETLPTYRTALAEEKEELANTLDAALKTADQWIQALSRKKANPDDTPTPDGLSAGAWDVDILRKYEAANGVISRNNEAVDNFANEQKAAKSKIKAHHLADHQSGYDEAVALEEKTKEARDKAVTALAKLRQKVGTLRAQLRTHGPAAGELNRLLKSYLGHSHISLQAVDDGYRICRDGKVSRKPLSEGEKTAVAFCYFVTSLASEGRRSADLIVVLDDPISSLDARAMTHVVSMIRRRFSSLTQLFILTHNLEFMREMKKWLGKKYEKELAEFLFIETGVGQDGRRSSQIVKMPKLIREYESEYHYLYSLVKQLADNPQDGERYAYLMPNAIRKVLDIFLAFKDPGASGLEPKVDKLIQDNNSLDDARVKAMERLAQLESHSESIGDVITFSAYTLEQVTDAARCLLEVIETVDPKHKQAMDRLCKP
jgi:wobble nucleotide-excising tRNase